jgi:hypothetical protein
MSGSVDVAAASFDVVVRGSLVANMVAATINTTNPAVAANAPRHHLFMLALRSVWPHIREGTWFPRQSETAPVADIV